MRPFGRARRFALLAEFILHLLGNPVGRHLTHINDAGYRVLLRREHGGRPEATGDGRHRPNANHLVLILESAGEVLDTACDVVMCG